MYFLFYSGNQTDFSLLYVWQGTLGYVVRLLKVLYQKQVCVSAATSLSTASSVGSNPTWDSHYPQIVVLSLDILWARYKYV